MSKTYYVYIMTNFKNNVFYTGVTNNLSRRIWEHKQKLVGGFTQKYNLFKLVYFEEGSEINEALDREKKLKKWKKEWKLNLIKAKNPDLKDLSVDWYKDERPKIAHLVRDDSTYTYQLAEEMLKHVPAHAGVQHDRK